MPASGWLRSLKPASQAFIDGDMDCLAPLDYPFLNQGQVCEQVECLSGHLGRLGLEHRRAVIGYSLYTRQLEAVQERTGKAFCAGNCGRPPVGCCNAAHYRVHSLADFMIGRPSGLAMQLAASIEGLQRSEDAWSRHEGLTHTSDHCAYLAERGCTLLLFKSPRCIHYICPHLEADLLLRFPGAAPAYAAAMSVAAVSTSLRSADFTSPEVLAAACLMLPGIPGA
ncbi:hypothetical protein [Fundidesulfovibrio soli]|uniref:hypothetical protein n=1 Tax=Fundidesulfovibrio soli TaxID=2922716 RepID=UPI001FB01C46|nr:hypothetical protein [Fundidesulfovibrio soli]